MDRTFVDRIALDAERQRARDVAQALLDGQTTVLEAVRALSFLAHTDAIVDVEDRRLIIAIDSQTDHLPAGDVRKLWAADSLAIKDTEIKRWEDVYKAQLVETCKRIVGTRQ